MIKEEYKWYLTFEKRGQPFTLSEDHQDFKRIRDTEGMSLYSATLLKLKYLSKGDEPDMGDVVHHVIFEDSKLLSIFRRTEQCNGLSRVIPSLQLLQNGKHMYAFAFPDKVFITNNRRYYREDWDYARP